MSMLGRPLPPNIAGNEPTVYVLTEEEQSRRIAHMQRMIGSHKRSIQNAEENNATPAVFAVIYADLAHCYQQLDYATRGQLFDTNAAERNRERNAGTLAKGKETRFTAKGRG